MKIKQNLILMLLVSVLALALAACGGQAEPTPAPVQPTEPASSAPEQPAEPATAVPAPEQPAEPATAVPAPEQPEADTSSQANIVGILWKWESFQDTAGQNDITVDNPDNYTLVFAEGNLVNIKADCNTVQGTYTRSGNSLSIELGPSTLAFCGEASLDEQFLDKLSSAGTFVMQDGKLVINLAADAGNMVFINGGPAGAAGAFCDEIKPHQFSLNTMGLPYSWQANCIPATPYDASQPPGPQGLPEHIQINFGVVNPEDKQPGDPVIYIIPAAAYRQMWEAAGDPAVPNALDQLQTMIQEQAPIPASGNVALPLEETAGFNDIAAQGTYLNLGDWDGMRFVGRFQQSPNPVTNEGLHYIFQGFAGENNEYFVAFFYPVTTPYLPNDASQVPAEEMGRVDNDNEAYMAEKAALLNGLADADWDPALAILDQVLASLEYEESYTPDPVPTAVLPTPEPETAYGRVTAPIGVNIRTGPGANYPVIGMAPYNVEGAIIGKSANGQWWVTPIEGAPNNQGWVSAAYVDAFNVENVPVIQAPPPPVPTATPTPPPAAQINFWADRTTINQGECTTLRWDVRNIQAVWVYPAGQPYDRWPVTGQGSRQECPGVTTTYEMRVQKRDGATETRQITIQVNPGDPLANTSWLLTSLNVNETLVPGTTLTLTFQFGGQVGGHGGCNSFSGAYSINGSSLFLGPLRTSGISCGDAYDAQEQTYLNLLQSAQTFELSGNQLIIRNAGGQEVLRFNRN